MEHAGVCSQHLKYSAHELMQAGSDALKGARRGLTSSDRLAESLSSARFRLRSMISLGTLAFLACSITCCRATLASGSGPPDLALHRSCISGPDCCAHLCDRCARVGLSLACSCHPCRQQTERKGHKEPEREREIERTPGVPEAQSVWGEKGKLPGCRTQSRHRQALQAEAHPLAEPRI